MELTPVTWKYCRRCGTIWGKVNKVPTADTPNLPICLWDQQIVMAQPDYCDKCSE